MVGMQFDATMEEGLATRIPVLSSLPTKPSCAAHAGRRCCTDAAMPLPDAGG